MIEYKLDLNTLSLRHTYDCILNRLETSKHFIIAENDLH